MADNVLRLKNNIDGNFFVDATCVGCDMCVIDAPKFFKKTEPNFNFSKAADGVVVTISEEEAKALYGKAFVYYQPTTELEKNEIRDTMLICPTDSIGEVPN